MRILPHGNNGERGFILLDALLCLFISLFLFLFLEFYGTTAVGAAQKLLSGSIAVINSEEGTNSEN
jgi:hypothetical protein